MLKWINKKWQQLYGKNSYREVDVVWIKNRFSEEPLEVYYCSAKLMKGVELPDY